MNSEKQIEMLRRREASSEKLIETARKRRYEDAFRHFQQETYKARVRLQEEWINIEKSYLEELSWLPVIIKTKWGVLFG